MSSMSWFKSALVSESAREDFKTQVSSQAMGALGPRAVIDHPFGMHINDASAGRPVIDCLNISGVM